MNPKYITILWVILCPLILFSEQNTEIQVSIDCVRIPAFQALYSTQKVDNKIISKPLRGSVVTKDFPQGLLIFQMSKDIDHTDLIEHLRKNLPFQIPEYAQMIPLVKHRFQFDSGKDLNAKFNVHKIKDAEDFPLKSECWIKFVPLIMQDKRLIVKIKYKVKNIEEGDNDKNTTSLEVLFDQIFSFDLKHTYLIGVRSKDSLTPHMVHLMAVDLKKRMFHK